jgi:hypothetical protein
MWADTWPSDGLTDMDFESILNYSFMLAANFTNYWRVSVV